MFITFEIRNEGERKGWITIDHHTGIGAWGETPEGARGRLVAHVRKWASTVAEKERSAEAEKVEDHVGARPFGQIQLAHDLLSIWRDAPEETAQEINNKLFAANVRGALCWVLRHRSGGEPICDLLQFTYGQFTRVGGNLFADTPMDERPDLLDMFGVEEAPGMEYDDWRALSPEEMDAIEWPSPDDGAGRGEEE